MSESIITNIDISRDYEKSLGTDEVHYQSFAQMAEFFGRDMQPHCHADYFQLHYLVTGSIELQLDDQRYSVQAPLFVLTPPAMPHAFVTKADSDGHVLTVRQELIRPIAETLFPRNQNALNLPGICLSLADKPEDRRSLDYYWRLIRQELTDKRAGYENMLILLAQAVFTLLLRGVSLGDGSTCGIKGELKLFQRFNQMIEDHADQHWSIPEYAEKLGVTESRLTDMCRRFANRPPKKLIFDQQLRRAKRLLLFSDNSVHEIAYQLGFKDPAYFARFFNRLTGCSPTAFRVNRTPVS